MNIIKVLATEFGLTEDAVEKTVALIDEGSVKPDSRKGNALKVGDPVIGRGNHSFYLVIFTLGKRDIAAKAVVVTHKDSALTLIAISQSDIVFKALLCPVCHRHGALKAVHLFNVVARR